ncbi:MAG: hypothetical protein LRY55_08740, partial [Leadbetterella sp.]|nr:hypothetical protein [Leadbetterella sp.]
MAITIEGVLGEEIEGNFRKIYFRNYKEEEEPEFIIVPSDSFASEEGSKDYGPKIGELKKYTIEAETLVTLYTKKRMSMFDFSKSFADFKPGTVSPHWLFQ